MGTPQPKGERCTGEFAMKNDFRFTLADDDDKFLFIMHHLLMQNFPGSSIASFSNAEDALHYVLDSGADLVITDHTMGSMTGTQLIKELRKAKMRLPIMMISGDEDAQKEALDAGASEFLHKNLVLGWLVDRVKFYLQPARKAHA